MKDSFPNQVSKFSFHLLLDNENFYNLSSCLLVIWQLNIMFNCINNVKSGTWKNFSTASKTEDSSKDSSYAYVLLWKTWKFTQNISRIIAKIKRIRLSRQIIPLQCRNRGDMSSVWSQEDPLARKWQPNQYCYLGNPIVKEPGRLPFHELQRVENTELAKQNV